MEVLARYITYTCSLVVIHSEKIKKEKSRYAEAV